ncbi:MAG TPA: hypothetical protein PLJ27_01195 [Polyangiaceae bacterium]|nr:MAG: hypothetical protein BWY17_01290 [Deltaproteobacteria bacterium ADurb.Bin207]HNS96649.1 hypothetical protein [Polyangiaceae bacterium]HNZ23040.1 hypothetical protein [Polyangiaceae bacterium]HOD21183.1 hypothetical protein [Polyangiaceae bacterium]HOE49053.1 hypothetical protein [Polyangiaceae bacterium]
MASLFARILARPRVNPTPSPFEIVARAAPGPNTVIRFVDEPFRVSPLSVLIVNSPKPPIRPLPVYDVDGGPFAELVLRRSPDRELPRFELTFPEGITPSLPSFESHSVSFA